MRFFQNLIRHLHVPKHFKKAGPQSMFNPHSYLAPEPTAMQRKGHSLVPSPLISGVRLQNMGSADIKAGSMAKKKVAQFSQTQWRKQFI